MREIGATRREERAGSEVLGRKCELGSGAGEVCFFVMCVHCSWSEFSCITAAQNVRAFKISDTVSAPSDTQREAGQAVDGGAELTDAVPVC
jgi:hypothetical protein